MWNNWLDAGRSIAEKAKEAAEGIEAQLNDSVGLTSNYRNNSNDSREDKNEEHFSHANSFTDKDEVFNDTFDDSFDDDDDDGNNMAYSNSAKDEELDNTVTLSSLSSPTLVSTPTMPFHDNPRIDHTNQDAGIKQGDSSQEIENDVAEGEGEVDDEIEGDEDQMEEVDFDIEMSTGDENGWNLDDAEVTLSQDEEDNKMENENLYVDSSIPSSLVEEENFVVGKEDINDEPTQSTTHTDQEQNPQHELEVIQFKKTDEIEKVGESAKGISTSSTEKELTPESETQVIVDDVMVLSSSTCMDQKTEFSEIENEDMTRSVLPNAELENPMSPVEISESSLMVILEPSRPELASETNIAFDNARETMDFQNEKIMALQADITALQSKLSTRETQLESKSSQLAELQSLHEAEKDSLRTTIKETKEEAKRRILRAKERVEDMQERLKNTTIEIEQFRNNNNRDVQDKDSIIEELRKEGETLAKSQGKMNENVRKAREEIRELNSTVEALRGEKATMQDVIAMQKQKIDEIEKNLSIANKEKDRALTLTKELSSTKETSQQHEAMKLSLEQEIKELKKSHEQYKKEMLEKQEAETEKINLHKKSIQREKEDFMADMEKKLRNTEKEANLREDALRRELEELRKRWQDAVNRADVLSMDVQQSTAPLIRQLESTERTNRIRAAAWTEMEQKLRSDMEEMVIKNEDLQKSVSELQLLAKKNERQLQNKESQMESLSNERDVLLTRVETLEDELEQAKSYGDRMKEEWMKMERSTNESSTKIRNDMMKAVMDNEARYKEEVEELKKELAQSIEERLELEKQLESLLNSSSSLISSSNAEENKTMGNYADQASILESTLNGLDNLNVDQDQGDDYNALPSFTAMSSSFVAMERLSQNLRASKLELEALRKQLSSSEETREAIQEELASARIANEKLPLFEKQVEELTFDLKEKQMDIDEMRENMMEVKEMYRAQLDNLLEEKVAHTPATPSNIVEEEDEGFSTDNDFAAANFDVAYSG